MFFVGTNCFRDFVWFFVRYFFGFIMANLLMFFHTLLFVFIVTNFWFMIILRIVTVGSFAIASFVFLLLMTNLFHDVFANFFRDILTFLDLFMLNHSLVNCFVMSFTFFMGFLLMVGTVSLIT